MGTSITNMGTKKLYLSLLHKITYNQYNSSTFFTFHRKKLIVVSHNMRVCKLYTLNIYIFFCVSCSFKTTKPNPAHAHRALTPSVIKMSVQRQSHAAAGILKLHSPPFLRPESEPGGLRDSKSKPFDASTLK